jgi:tol-pal system protein YbgF
MIFCRASSFVVVLMLLCSCVAPSKDTASIYNRLSNNEKQIRDISRQLNMSTDGIVPGQAEMWSQIQSMRQDINQIVGQFADWEQQNADGENFAQLRARVQRLEAAVRKMGSVLAIDLGELDVQLSSAVVPDSAVNAGQVAGGALAESATDAYNVSGNVPGNISGNVSGNISGNVIADAAATAETIAAASSAGPVSAQPLERSADMASTLYNSGTKAFSDRRYQDAVKIFQDFVKTYPKNKLTSNAYFWQGEAYYQLKNYSKAIVSYQQIIENFSGSTKLQSAMFKQGVSMYKKDQQDAGKVRLNELIAKFPKSQEADRARQFLKSNS